MNKIKKIISRLIRSFIYKLDGVSTKAYMNLYNNWLKKNGMNITGKVKYINRTAFLDGTGYNHITLGDGVVISYGVTLLVHDFSIEAGLNAIGKKIDFDEAYTMKDIVIGDNCFIGANVTILGGTKLGKNCIVGAGSILPGKSYPDNSIICGNPGKVIGDTLEWAESKLAKKEFDIGYFN